MKSFCSIYLLCIPLFMHAQEIFPLGTGLNGNVNVIAPYFNSVYAGGDFTDAGGNPEADYLAVWNGESWLAVIPGLNGPVHSIISTPQGMYIGGAFTSPYHYFAIFDYDWLTWISLGDSLSGPVKHLAEDHSRAYSVFVAGDFDGHLLKWSSHTWTSLSGDVTGEINVLRSRNNELFVGGKFSPAGAGMCVFNIYRNDAWVNMTQPSDLQHVYDLALHHQEVFLCGYPTTFCEGGMGGIHEPVMRWDRTMYHTLGHFGGCRVASNLCIQGNSLFVDALDPLGEEAIFRWDLQAMEWNGFLAYFQEAVSEDQVHCMATDGDDIFLGGMFTNFGSINGDHIVGVDYETTSTSFQKNPGYFHIRPQPAHGSIQFDIPGDDTSCAEINIYDLRGCKLIHLYSCNRQVDIEELDPGLYLMEIRAGNTWLTSKLLKL